MRSSGLFTYIAMIVLAASIAFFYIQPTFNDIRAKQDDIATFKQERERVTEVNENLNELVGTLDSISVADQQKLLTYIPDDVDTIAVPRTLQNIAEQSGVLLDAVSFDEINKDYVDQAEIQGEKDYPVPYIFRLSVQGTYGQMKSLLSLLEVNEYPLEVHELDIAIVDGTFLQADIGIVTYSHEFPPQSFFTNR